MENFNVPLLAESNGSSIVSYAANGNNESNNQHRQHLQQQPPQHHQQQLLPHHHKDQMLAAGSSPILPFINYAQLQKDTQSNPDSNPAVDNFTTLQAIDSNQLDVAVSLSGLCDRIFASPNPHSSHSTNNNPTDPKVSTPSSGNNGPLILESVTMSSFANILLNNRNTTNTTTMTNTNNNNNNQTTVNIETLNSIDPLLLQKSNPVEYHQLKPLKNGSVSTRVVSSSGFLSSTTAQLLDFEVAPSSNSKDAVVATSNGMADITTTTPAASAGATGATSGHRRSQHSIEELAASSCDAAKVNTTSITTQVQKQQHQQHQTGNLSGSNISSDDESISEDEFGLEIDDQGGK